MLPLYLILFHQFGNRAKHRQTLHGETECAAPAVRACLPLLWDDLGRAAELARAIAGLSHLVDGREIHGVLHFRPFARVAGREAEDAVLRLPRRRLPKRDNDRNSGKSTPSNVKIRCFSAVPLAT